MYAEVRRSQKGKKQKQKGARQKARKSGDFIARPRSEAQHTPIKQQQ
jgi:hypothetical protein